MVACGDALHDHDARYVPRGCVHGTSTPRDGDGDGYQSSEHSSDDVDHRHTAGPGVEQASGEVEGGRARGGVEGGRARGTSMPCSIGMCVCVCVCVCMCACVRVYVRVCC